MYGWRARIGLVLPLDNTVMEPELSQLPIPGVSFHVIRLSTIERSKMPVEGIRIAKGFVEMGVDGVVYACAETAFLKGIEGNAFIAQEITRLTNLPATTAMSAKVHAARALNVQRIGLVTPYTAPREKVMIDFWERMGVSVAASLSRDFNEGTGESREWYHTNLQPPWVAYDMARSVDRPDVDAIVISATNFRTLEIVRQLEEDTGKAVITSNQAIVWHMLGLLGLNPVPIPELGRLGGTPLPKPVESTADSGGDKSVAN